jgi:hypothetical protein
VSDLEVRNIHPVELDALLVRPLPRLRKLTLIYPHLDGPHLDRLFDAPLMQQLTDLKLANAGFGLLTRPRPASLHRLELSDVTLDAATTEALFGTWTGLQRLDLQQVNVDTSAATRLLGSGGLATLESLRLVDCGGMEPQVVAALFRNRALARLRMLAFTRRADPLASEVLETADLPALEYLDLWSTRLQEGAALGRSPLAARLRGLKLNRCGLDREDAAALFAGDFRRLERLELEGARITGGSRGALLSAPWLPGLKHLALDWGRLKPTDGRALARCPALSGLRILSLRNNTGLKDDGLLPVVLSPHLAQLEILRVDGTNATVALARSLADAPMLASLRQLRLDLDSFHAAVGLGESARNETFRSLYWDRGMPR